MNNQLVNWRKQIDVIDGKIISHLAKRMEITRAIGKYKKKHNISLLDKKRWQEIINLHQKTSENLGLSKKFVKDI